MSLLDVHREINRQTRIKARQHKTRTFLIAFIASALLTYGFYAIGLIQHDPRYTNIPLPVSTFLVGFNSFTALLIIQLIILYCKSAGEYTAPKVVDGYWTLVSKALIRNKVKKDLSDGTWEYIKEHRKHDPLYQADLEDIRTESDTKLESIKIEFNKRLENAKTEYDKKLDDIVRAYRIRTLAWEKERNLGKQARRERDYERQLNQKLTRLVIILSKIIIDLKAVIKKLKGE
ncbi:MAG: hypothetical protein KGI19_10655 [Thaumarchaeota archaeon]|nr:hypothetical protein [Nitrososphaerota archaeon]